MTLKDTARNTSTAAHCVLFESCQNGRHCGGETMVCRSDVSLEAWIIERPLSCVVWHEPTSVNASTCSLFGKQVSPSGDLIGVGVEYYSESPREGLFGFRTPVEAKVFSSCHADRPSGPTSLLYNGCRLSLPGIKWPGCVVDYPPPSVYSVITVIAFSACMAGKPLKFWRKYF